MRKMVNATWLGLWDIRNGGLYSAFHRWNLGSITLLQVRGHQTTRNSYLSSTNLCNPNGPVADDSLTYRAEDSVIPTQNTSGRLLVRLHLFPLAFRQLNRSALGGWWVRPSNWATNTAVVAMGILTITYGVWNVSSKYEVCVRVTSNFLFYPFLPITIVAVFFINFLRLSLTNVFLLLDSNGWCSQIDQYPQCWCVYSFSCKLS